MCGSRDPAQNTVADLENGVVRLASEDLVLTEVVGDEVEEIFQLFQA
jgi:hypothetical protein